MRNGIGIGCAVVAALAGTSSAQINVAATANAALLQNALINDGSMTIHTFVVSGQTNGAISTGLYWTSGPNNYLLDRPGIVLSSGNAGAYGSGPNTSGSFSHNYLSGDANGGPGVPSTLADDALLNPITGGLSAHFDVTRIDITFEMNPGFNTVGFDVVFGSDEFPEFVGSSYIDGFGLYLDGTNIAFQNGFPISINHPGMANVPETELDGVVVTQFGSPLMRFLQPVGAGVHTLTFIICDTADGIYDSTAYIAGLGVPAPGAGALFGLGLFAMARRRR